MSVINYPCPVCLHAVIVPGNTYCSEQCRRAAYNFRKRLSPVLSFLKSVDFSVEWQNGTQLVITLPEYLEGAYPVTLHDIEFPDPGLDVDKLNADDLWQTLRAALGTLVNGTLAFMCGALYDGVIAKEMLQSAVLSSLYHDHTSFLCRKCGRRFIVSAQSAVDKTRCAECAIERIPF